MPHDPAVPPGNGHRPPWPCIEPLVSLPERTPSARVRRPFPDPAPDGPASDVPRGFLRGAELGLRAVEQGLLRGASFGSSLAMLLEDLRLLVDRLERAYSRHRPCHGLVEQTSTPGTVPGDLDPARTVPITFHCARGWVMRVSIGGCFCRLTPLQQEFLECLARVEEGDLIFQEELLEKLSIQHQVLYNLTWALRKVLGRHRLERVGSRTTRGGTSFGSSAYRLVCVEAKWVELCSESVAPAAGRLEESAVTQAVPWPPGRPAAIAAPVSQTTSSSQATMRARESSLSRREGNQPDPGCPKGRPSPPSLTFCGCGSTAETRIPSVRFQGTGRQVGGWSSFRRVSPFSGVSRARAPPVR